MSLQMKTITYLSTILSSLTEFPAPKNENFQHFHVYYLGCEAVAKPVGKKHLGVHNG